MPQESTNSTYNPIRFGNVYGDNNGEMVAIELANGKPTDLDTHKKRIWIDPLTHTVNYTTDGQEIHTVLSSNLIVYDNFNRPNNSTLGVATSGQSWTGTGFGIIDNVAGKTSGSSPRASIATGISNGFVQFTEKKASEPGILLGVWFRRTNDSNYWRLVAVSNSLILQKVVSNAATTVISVGILRKEGNIYAARFSGDAISIYANGSFVGEVNDAFNNTGDSHGIFASNTTTGRVDNFLYGSL